MQRLRSESYSSHRGVRAAALRAMTLLSLSWCAGCGGETTNLVVIDATLETSIAPEAVAEIGGELQSLYGCDRTTWDGAELVYDNLGVPLPGDTWVLLVRYPSDWGRAVSGGEGRQYEASGTDATRLTVGALLATENLLYDVSVAGEVRATAGAVGDDGMYAAAYTVPFGDGDVEVTETHSPPELHPDVPVRSGPSCDE